MAEKKRGPGRPPGSKNKNTKSQSNSKSATAKATPKTKQEQIREMQDKRGSDYRTIDIVWGLSIVAIGVFFFFTIVLDNTGALGRAVHDICLGLFGIMAWLRMRLLTRSEVVRLFICLIHSSLFLGTTVKRRRSQSGFM